VKNKRPGNLEKGTSEMYLYYSKLKTEIHKKMKVFNTKASGQLYYNFKQLRCKKDKT
jgi:hypothetical protein